MEAKDLLDRLVKAVGDDLLASKALSRSHKKTHHWFLSDSKRKRLALLEVLDEVDPSLRPKLFPNSLKVVK